MNLIRVQRPRLSLKEIEEAKKGIKAARENAKYAASMYAEIHRNDPLTWDLVEEIIFYENLPEGVDGMDLSDY